MSVNYSAFIFPAFASDYKDHPGEKLPGFQDYFQELLMRAARAVDPVLEDFSFSGITFQGDELRTQYITYIYSCAASGILRRKNMFPDISAGYSMGIYAALYDAGSVGFESGLELIRAAFDAMRLVAASGSFGMGTLIGLSSQDIQQILDQHSLNAEITNQNAPYSFVVSGYKKDVGTLLLFAAEEGALHTRSIEVSIPYHAGMLKECAMNFASRISHVKFSEPGTLLYSLVDQRGLDSPELIRNEVIRNLYHPLNWFITMQVMLMKQHSTGMFIECGPSGGLAKNAKFVSGNYHFYTLNTIPATSFLP